MACVGPDLPDIGQRVATTATDPQSPDLPTLHLHSHCPVRPSACLSVTVILRI